GLGYTLVDDTHFYYAGLAAGDMFGYHLTEREGHTLALFPTNKELRYTIPFQEPARTVDFLGRAYAAHGPTCATYGDDMEKFGLWPETWEWVFGKGWLVKFFEKILEASDWLATTTPSDFLATHPASGRVYPPTASYEEMLTWALPAEASAELEDIIHELQEEGRFEKMRRFLRGGQWDNFLIKYRESNLMHKRMLWVSDKVAAAGEKDQARDHLMQAQCNCAYWHGRFGGLYLGHLRQAVHEHLIAAEDILDKQAHGNRPWAACAVADLDLDGNDEVVLSGPALDAVVHPAYGGSVSVLDLRAQRFNLADTLTRRFEAYHQKLVQAAKAEAEAQGEKATACEAEGVASIHDRVVFKEEGLEDYLIYDWYDRACFQDHLLAPKADLEKFQRPDYGEWGDLVTGRYALVQSGSQGEEAWCRLERASNLFAPGGPYPLTMAKGFDLGPGPRLAASYRLTTSDPATPAFRLAVELNFTLLSASDPGKHLEYQGHTHALDHAWELAGVGEMALVNSTDRFSLRLFTGQAAAVWHFPVETVSNSESGLERTYQGSSLSFIWEVPGGAGTWEFSLGLELR
ncbi:MAG: alpha-amylase/4-alpha-glucanotransferase domain-containing protein, partial [Pseudomonadota bacterium]